MVTRLLLLLLGISCIGFVKGQEDDDLTFIVIGDWGETLLPGQQRVADRMAEYAEENPLHFIATTGDNFYPNGVQTVDSPQFDNKWRYIYNHSSLEHVPWYISVGNHDYRWEEWAQVNFSFIEPRWIFPNLWHSDMFQAGDSVLHLVMIDSEALGVEENDPEAMLEWMEEELANSDADFKLVLGHRHIYSTGDYGPVSNRMHEQIRPILERNNADMYVCGHDHNLQLLVDTGERDTVDYVVSAGGGALTYPYSEEAEERLATEFNITKAFFERTWGFVSFKVTTDQMELDFWDDDGANRFNYIRSRKDWK